MADPRHSADDDALPSTQQHRQERPGSSAADETKPSELDAPDSRQSSEARQDAEDQQGPPGPPTPTAPVETTSEPAKPTVDPIVTKRVSDVMASEVGIPSLLNRLKQSIASAKEFGLFLKKRSILEEDHAQSLRKLCRSTQDNSRRPEHRQGTFSSSYDEMVHIHDRMAENGAQFAASLHQMHDDLVEVVANAERGRKTWKTNGLAAEHKVADLELVMRKSKAKYDSLAEEYDRARTGEPKQGGGKVLGAFKAHKSAAQQEEDLLRKVQGADQTYQGHVQTLQNEKTHLEKSARPEAVKALHELISETDSAVTLQMQKFASFNEKLLLGNGLIVSPFKSLSTDGPKQPRSLRQAVAAIDNEKDLNDFMASQHGKIQPYNEVKYERNPILKPPSSPIHQQHPPQSMHAPQMSGQISSPQDFAAGSRTSTGNFGTSAGGVQDPNRSYTQNHGRSFSHGNMLDQQGPPSSQQQQNSNRNSIQPSQRFGSSMTTQGLPQIGALPFQSSQPVPPPKTPPSAGAPFQPPNDARGAAGPGYGGAAPPAFSAAPRNMPASSQPVYGVSLNRLYERDGLAVPMVVYQCIQAVDLFGLGLEGIYRQSGSLNHINKLKGMFDTDSSNPALDFRNPENFFHDVNSVAGLLKQFFRDLPDPLLTSEHHDAFVNAAKHEDDIVRRDSLHAIINALPDPNYATLRAITLHLYRVMDNSHLNRMNSHNLAVIFGPTLMGSDPSTAIADAGWQIKVIDTILQNTYQIFDED